MTIIAALLKSWILVLLVSTIPSLQQSILGERVLPPLSEESLLHLSSSPDPLKNLNPNDPNAHISHILIPRPRMFQTSSCWSELNYCISGYHQQYQSQKLYYFGSQSVELV